MAHHILNWRRVRWIDNPFRTLVHNPARLYSSYLKAGMRIADIGCGAGFASIGMAKMIGETGEVIAVDLQPEIFPLLRKRAVKAGVSERIKTKPCAQDSLMLDGQFDFINAFYMVHEVPDQERLFQELVAALKDGGKLFIAEPGFGHVTQDDFEMMIKRAQDAGLEVESYPRVLFSRAVVFVKS